MFFSVVIPTYDRKPILEKCLLALERQHLTAESVVSGYEVVLVDDGSTDGTLSWLESHKDRFPHVIWFQQDHQGPSAAYFATGNVAIARHWLEKAGLFDTAFNFTVGKI